MNKKYSLSGLINYYITEKYYGQLMESTRNIEQEIIFFIGYCKYKLLPLSFKNITHYSSYFLHFYATQNTWEIELKYMNNNIAKLFHKEFSSKSYFRKKKFKKILNERI